MAKNYEVELLEFDPILELLFGLGISADEWSCGVLDENIPDLHDYDNDNVNPLGLTVEQRQLILDTLLGRKTWGFAKVIDVDENEKPEFCSGCGYVHEICKCDNPA